jgi:hypothetical protein
MLAAASGIIKDGLLGKSKFKYESITGQSLRTPLILFK